MTSVGIVGLGYVGLPLAYAFSQAGHKVVGFDIIENKIADLKNGIDITHEVGPKIKDANITFTTDPSLLKDVEIIINCVPTPINKQKNPDLIPLEKSSETIGSILQKGQIVVYESTVFPGCTEEICLPILEKMSGLSCPADFSIGYSPERINPGDKVHTVENIVKVVAGYDTATCDTLASLYTSIIKAGVFKASSIKVAEAAKVIENTQRDVNIALMNELSEIFNKLDINTHDVLAAAGTKWNFLNFYPGLVGGHCIGVDPYRLAYKAEEVGHHPEIILAGRRINDAVAERVARGIIDLLIQAGKPIQGSTILVLGITFKPNVPDFRNSKIADTIALLQQYGIDIVVYDPYHSYLDTHSMNELHLDDTHVLKTLTGSYDGIIINSFHEEFKNIDFTTYLANEGIIFDIPHKLEQTSYSYYASL